MSEPNPFRVLEFTPALVRLFRDNPAHLLKVAEAHRKFILFQAHPDRVVGGEERSKQLNAALSALKNTDQRDQAIEEFLTAGDPDREFFAPALREVRRDLGREQQALRTAREQHRREIGQLEEAAVHYGRSITAWASASIRSLDFIQLIRPEGDETLHLQNALLITDAARPGHVNVLLCGRSRQIYRRLEVKADSLSEILAAGVEGLEDQRRQLSVLGSYLGRNATPFQPEAVPQDPKRLMRFALEVQPCIEIGKPVVLLERVRGEGERIPHLRYQVFGALREVRRGSTMRLEKLIWLPHGKPGRHKGA